MVLSVQIVALSFKFAAILAAIAAFAYFISIVYSTIISPEILKGTLSELMAKAMPIFACGFGAFALERLSLALERLEQEGLFSAITLVTFSVLIGIYSSMLQGAMSFFAIPVYTLLGVVLVVLMINKDRFSKDGSNSLVYYTLITTVLGFLAAFFPV
jgi:hypothetical protein